MRILGRSMAAIAIAIGGLALPASASGSNDEAAGIEPVSRDSVVSAVVAPAGDGVATAVTGEVYDSETGAPIAGIEVGAFNGTVDGQSVYARDVTDAAGAYTLDVSGAVDAGHTVRVGAVDPAGNYAARRNIEIVPQRGYVEALAFTMDPGGSVVGTVVDHTGAPVPNAHISIDVAFALLPFPLWWGPILTDENGEFATAGLAAQTWPMGVSANSNAYSSVSTEVDVVVGQATSLDVVLEAFAPMALTGVVRDVDGVVQSGVQVRIVQSGTTEPVAFGNSQPDGTYNIVASSGFYDVVVIDPAQERTAYITGIDLTESTTLDIVVESIVGAEATFEGTVALPEGWTGDVSVECTPGGGIDAGSAPLDATGSYSITVPLWSLAPCWWGVSVADGLPGTWSSSSANRYVNVDPSAAVDVSVDMSALFTTTVLVDGESAPIDYVDVTMTGDLVFDDGVVGSVSASAGGSNQAVFLLPVGLARTLEYMASAPFTADSATVDVTGLTEYVIDLPPPTTQISGTVGLPNGYVGEVTVACEFGSFTAPVQADGSYELAAEWDVDANRLCDWSVDATNTHGSVWVERLNSLYLSPVPVTVDLPAPAEFVVSTRDGADLIAADTFDAELVGLADFGDGSSGNFRSIVSGVTTSSIALPSWDPRDLAYAAVMPWGETYAATVGVIGLATFDVDVDVPDTTPPVVSVVGVSDGDQFIVGTPVAPTCATFDDDSGVATFAALTIDDPIHADGVGVATATCAGAVDVAGNIADPVSVTYLFVYARDAFTKGGLVTSPGVNEGNAGKKFSLRWKLSDVNGVNFGGAAVVRADVHLVDCVGFAELDEAPGGAGEPLGAVSVTGAGEYRLSYKSSSTPGCSVVAVLLADTTSILAKFDTR